MLKSNDFHLAADPGVNEKVLDALIAFDAIGGDGSRRRRELLGRRDWGDWPIAPRKIPDSNVCEGIL